MPKKLALLSLFISILTISLILLLASKSPLFTPPIPPGKTYEVILEANGFSPNNIEIKSGDYIKFGSKLNQPFWPASDLHPTHGIYQEFDPQQPVDPDKTWTFQFLKTGRWKYHDHLQPYSRGVVNVSP